MTAEEKARDLMLNVCKIFGSANAKYGAILICDEVIEVLSVKDPKPGATYSNPGKFFWQQVKKHIEDNY